MKADDAWKRIPLGEIAPARGNPMPHDSETVWNLSLEDIEANTGRILKLEKCPIISLGSTKCSFDTRHVLYSKLRPYLNKVVVPDSSGVGTSELLPLRPDSERLNREFLAYYLRSPSFLDFAKANTRGANLPRIAMTELWQHRVPVPNTLSEQLRIVTRIKECLERVEEIERLRGEAVAQAEAALPSLLNETFVLLAERFRTKKIGDAALETRYGTSRKCRTQPHGTAILRIPNVLSGSVTFSDLKYCDLDRQERSNNLLKNGDLLFVRTNGSRDLVGRCAIFEAPVSKTEFGFASYLIRVRLDTTKLQPHFLAFFLNSTQGRTELNARRRTSAGQFNINSENLKTVALPVPPLKEQDRAIEVLRDRQAQMRAIHSEMRSAKADESHLRDAILRRAFAGEL